MKTFKSIGSRIFLTAIFCLSILSCKNEWLDAKPDKSLVVPSSAADYQTLLDNVSFFNTSACPYAEMASDDYTLAFNNWQSAALIQRNTFMWAKDQLEGNPNGDWNETYKRLLTNNIILEGLQKVSPTDPGYNAVKGTALFNRAYDFYNLAQQYCKVFSAETANDDLGVPLKLTGNVNEKIGRSSVSATYKQIINDFKSASGLLPATPLYKTRPSIPATYAMLARVYLSMEDYANAGLYADSCLQIYSTLIDYNTLSKTAARPVPLFNNEVIMNWDNGIGSIMLSGTVNPDLFNSYNSNDLRKTVFFNPTTKVFRGTYNATAIHHNGPSVDEVFLIRAECLARAGNTADAMRDLNTLLAKRFVAGTFTAVMATDPLDALKKVLSERRKELCFRGLRWTDLRRLNKDSRFAITLTRNLNGQIFTLPPNDPRYVFEIPKDEILISGIPQNIR